MIALMLLSCFSAKKVRSLHVVGAQEGLTACPGVPSPITVRVKQTNGKARSTAKTGREGLRWSELIVRMNGQSFEDGLIWLPEDPRESMGKQYALEVFLADRPEIGFETFVSPRWDCAYVADFSGEPGDAVQGGLIERYGMDGADGGHGGHGGSATAYVTTVEGPDGTVFLQARVTGTPNQGGQRLHYYLIDPRGGTLAVDVRGGAGGPGQDGYDGEDGDDGEERGEGRYGPGEDGEDGGSGGDGGDGGDGGQAALVVDPSAEPYLDSVWGDARGGAGGPGGAGGQGGDGGDGDPPGEDGDYGRPGRDGRDGRDGPAPELLVQEVKRQF